VILSVDLRPIYGCGGGLSHAVGRRREPRKAPEHVTLRPVIARAVATLAAVLLAAGCGSADGQGSDGIAGPTRVLQERQVGPRLIDLRIRSRALGTSANVRLMTPKAWSSRPGGRRWPILYLLHGCCDTYESWTRSTDIEELAGLRDVLVVMPEGGPVGSYSNWLGSRGQPGPAWETFHLSELRRILERDYGAGTRRVIAGQSMGGLGAMGYSARHPGLFLGAASFSGLLHPLGDTDFLLGLFSSYTPDPLAIWGDPERRRDVWSSHDPTALAGRLRRTQMFVSAGDGRPGPFDPADAEPDRIEQTALRESRAFVGRLRRLRLRAQVDFYGPGAHAWPYWERELGRALPVLLGALRLQRAASSAAL
jgi:diacylglycerol O-acyltransferase / trehalose O-mycolyltransferase